jgi:hypothetical protein
MLLLPAPQPKPKPLLWRPIRVMSFGGGTQSMAALVAQAQGLLEKPYDVFLMADVGHDSENRPTLKLLVGTCRAVCDETQYPAFVRA